MEEIKKETISSKIIFLKDWLIPILIALILGILINKFMFFSVFVPTGSMIPTINEDNKALVTRVNNLSSITRGDIIVFQSDELNLTLVKRLIGLPGDKIKIQNGVVFINGEELVEDYVKNKDYSYSGEFDIPEGKYFFLGDNRPDSNDARLWKNPYIDGSDIKGKFKFIFYPFEDFGFAK
ncbi:signal peptidase I [Clostridium botulinum]|uniref:Signal peptidase I n=1 Tax=Clostridium botulinum TaxID=1491 RepID=A0A6B4S859_CLOBO|nr:signal peptidase I [Clostridium botulinum]EES49837.1 signal peptidase I [Clostridium botulinum E1 str. 'BoNT E Beluga']MBY6760002.1 signal peptidase I [Clostridium botulinum]MBY6915551.1 signal peptidase I [Clostridium botulinum]MBY6918911.1 signal peptidase I [Clostridium botulinum]MCR1132558.1 signal peptidase I [Clostridium botulinum]